MLKMSDLNLLTKTVGDSVRKTKRTGDIRLAVDINRFCNLACVIFEDEK